MDFDPLTQELHEYRHLHTSVLDASRSQDFGIDLPIGGLGNPAPRDSADQLFIGPSGIPYFVFPHTPFDVQHFLFVFSVQLFCTKIEGGLSAANLLMLFIIQFSRKLRQPPIHFYCTDLSVRTSLSIAHKRVRLRESRRECPMDL